MTNLMHFFMYLFIPSLYMFRASQCLSSGNQIVLIHHLVWLVYEGHLESKERFAIKKYLLIIGKKKNMQVLSHTFTYFST